MFLLLFVLQAAIADDHDHDHDGHDHEKRKVDIKAKDDTFSVSAKSDTDVSKDIIDIDVRTKNDGLYASLQYHYKAADKKDGLKAKFSFSAKLVSVFEFIDDETPGYNNETKTKSFDLKTWTKFDPSYDLKDSNTADIVSVTNCSLDAGSFDVVTYYSASAKDVVVGNASSFEILPSGVKFDFLIRNFPFTATCTAAGPRCKLALVGRIRTKLKVKPRTGTLESSDDGGATAKWSWDNSVTADGASVSVIPTNWACTKDDTDSDSGDDPCWAYYYTFDLSTQPRVIYWDPELAVETSGALAPASLFAVGLALLIAVLM